VSGTFIERTRHALAELMSRQLADLRLAVMMIDAIELEERMTIVALRITTEGVKILLGLWEGSTENATVAAALLSDLVQRGCLRRRRVARLTRSGRSNRPDGRPLAREGAAILPSPPDARARPCHARKHAGGADRDSERADTRWRPISP
jgi:hypothetical protein